jgi:hypothetical protein
MNQPLSREQAEHLLEEWASTSRNRDNIVRRAVKAGVSKHRVHVITGLGRSTIDRILEKEASR